MSLGYNVDIKWFRNSHTFSWEGVSVMIDYTKGYGYIIELEKMSSEALKDFDLSELKAKMDSLGIEVSSKAEFSERYERYKREWRELV